MIITDRVVAFDPEETEAFGDRTADPEGWLRQASLYALAVFVTVELSSRPSLRRSEPQTAAEPDPGT